jgi:hypothetical protein
MTGGAVGRDIDTNKANRSVTRGAAGAAPSGKGGRH